jgi:C4-type Zn-finger protein
MVLECEDAKVRCAWCTVHYRTIAPCTMEKECPLCGDRMQLHTRETVTRVPGSPQEIKTIVREWICRECDYFEESDDDVSPSPP